MFLMGSTFGGSVIQIGYIGVSMYMEIYEKDTAKTLRTSAIQSFSVNPDAHT